MRIDREGGNHTLFIKIEWEHKYRETFFIFTIIQQGNRLVFNFTGI